MNLSHKILLLYTPNGTGEAVFSPLNLAPLHWWDFSDATNYTLVSGAYSQVNDKSVNSNHLVQATSGKRPTQTTHNGLNCASFDGTNDNMTLTTATAITGAMQYYIVLRYNGTPTSNAINSCYFGGTGNTKVGRLGTSTTGKILHRLVNAGTGDTGVDMGYNVNQTVIVSGGRNVSNSEFYKVNSGSEVNLPAETGTIGIDTIGQGDTNEEHMNGLICEVVLFNTKLVAGDHLSMVNYLSTKWIA